MDRRQYLTATASFGLAALAGLAGCSSAPNAPETDEEYRGEFERMLTGEGLAVGSLVVDERRVSLSYQTSQTTSRGLLDEIATVAAAYAVAVDNGWAVDRVDAAITDATGQSAGRFYILSEWAREFAAGDMSADDYRTLVLVTIRTGSN